MRNDAGMGLELSGEPRGLRDRVLREVAAGKRYGEGDFDSSIIPEREADRVQLRASGTSGKPGAQGCSPWAARYMR